MKHPVFGDVLVPAAGVLEQLAHGDLPYAGIHGGTGGGREVRKQIQEPGIQTEPAFFGEFENGHASQGFRDTGKAEHAGWLGLDAEFAVGVAEAPGIG